MNEPSPDIATQGAQHGSGMPVPDWARLLRCTESGARDADFVVSGNCVSIFWPESSSEHTPEIPILIWYKERV
jgi:hypothetical protein